MLHNSYDGLAQRNTPGRDKVVNVKVVLIAACSKTVEKVLFCLWRVRGRDVLIVNLTHEFQPMSVAQHKQKKGLVCRHLLTLHLTLNINSNSKESRCLINSKIAT